MIDLSIVIVSWNAKDFLYKCIKSIYTNSNNISFEIILVDNASTDGAPDLIQKKFPDVIVIRNKINLGFSKANNIGMLKSNGKYICLLNSDIELIEDCFSDLIQFMEENVDVGLVGPLILNSDYSFQPSCRIFPTRWGNFSRALALDKIFPDSKLFSQQFMNFIPINKTSKVDYLSGCFILSKRSYIDIVGLLDETFFFYAEDKDWCKRFWDNNFSVVYFPHVKAIHHLYGSSSKDPLKYYIQEINANLQYYDKHHNSSDKIWYLGTIYLHQIVRIIFEIIKLIIKNKELSESKLKLKRSLYCLKWLVGRIFYPAH